MSDQTATHLEPGSKETQSLEFECTFAEAPEKVWRALTVPALVAAWLMPNDLKPEQGARFTFQGSPGEGGDVDCEVLSVELQRRISYTWQDADARRHSLASIVTFELTPTAVGGTHLRIIHSGYRSAGIATQAPIAANLNQPMMMRHAA